MVGDARRRSASVLMPVASIVVALLGMNACVTPGAGGDEVRFGSAQLISTFVTWREAERRRDLELAAEVLYFSSRADKRRLEADFLSLAEAAPGRVVAEREVHLVAHPENCGEGDYLFLEPLGNQHVPVRARVIAVRGEPRIVYEPELCTVSEQRRLGPQGAARLNVERQIAFWKGLEGQDLIAELERLRRWLRCQQIAVAYAAEEGLTIPVFDPAPADLLAQLEGLDSAAARAWVIDRLEGL